MDLYLTSKGFEVALLIQITVDNDVPSYSFVVMMLMMMIIIIITIIITIILVLAGMVVLRLPYAAP